MEDNDAAQAGVQPLYKSSQELISPQQVRNKIKISNHQLLELVHSQCKVTFDSEKLLDRMNQLNHQGVLQIQAQNYTQALIFFDQCEQNLEYAASCGKTIDRNLIIAILNNEAMAYQRLQEHEKSASYVEAIIYNLKMFLESRQNQLLEDQLNLMSRNNSQKQALNSFIKTQLNNIYSFISRKYQLAIYLLQFSGLYSQCLSHEDSYKNAKLALTIMKELCKAYYNLLAGGQQNQNVYILKELSQLPLNFQKNQYQLLRSQFQKLNRINSQTNVSEEQEIYFPKSEDAQAINFQSIFSLKSKSIQQNILESQSILWNTINHQNHVKKVILVICMYFTMGVQLQEITSQEFDNCNSIYMFGSQKRNEKSDSTNAQMYHLMALIIGLKHLPYANTFLQNLISIYRQHYNHQTIESPLREQKSINQHLDKLTEKYKNYLIERDISMSLDQDSSSLIKQIDPQSQKKWNQEKKQSKKLNQLLKQELPHVFVNRGGQQSYFMEVPSIDSISMANSVSANKKDNSGRVDQPKYLHKQKGKINLHPKLKSSKTIGYEYESKQSQFYPTPPDSNNPISQRSRQDQYYDSTKRQKKKINFKSKSKSTHRNKSKAKLAQTKKIEKNSSNTVINAIPVLTLMTTVTDRSNKKIKLKRSPERDQKFMIGSAGGEANKWVGDLKKIASSDQIKSFKPNQFSSVKNVEPIKMNKVKAPIKMISSIPMNDPKPSQTIRLDQRKGNSNSQKNKSKSKSSASFKSKKSENNSKNKKSLSKTIKNSKQKIYTSIKQTIKRR